jgi:hypothetical protein
MGKLIMVLVLPNVGNPIQEFRNSLQILRAVDLAPPTWALSLLHTLQAALITDRAETLDTILREVLQPPAPTNLGELGDPVALFSVLIISMQLNQEPPLPAALPDILSRAFNHSSNPYVDTSLPQSRQTYAIAALARLIKYAILLTSSIRSEMAQDVISDIADSLRGQAARPVRAKVGEKRKKTGLVGMEIGSKERGCLEVLVRSLGGDEELARRTGAFEALASDLS